MKVAFIAPTTPYKGGISLHMTFMADELAKRHQVLFLSWKAQCPSFVIKDPIDPLLPKNQNASFGLTWYNPFSWLWAALKISWFRPQLLIYPWTHPFFGLIFFWITLTVRIFSWRTEVLYVAHNVKPHHEDSFFDALFRKMGFWGVENFIVHAESEKQKLLAIKPNAKAKIVFPAPLLYENEKTILSQAETTAFKRELGLKNKQTLLFFGYVRPYKGLKFLIEAMPALPDADLLIVGEFWDDRDDYILLIEKLGVKSRVFIVGGYVPNPDIRKYFSVCDLVVLPYVTATQSGPIQLAYLFEKPMIGSAVGGLEDAIEDGKTGYLVPPQDPAAIAGAVERYFRKRPDFSPAIKAYREKYTWPYYASVVESFLN